MTSDERAEIRRIARDVDEDLRRSINKKAQAEKIARWLYLRSRQRTEEQESNWFDVADIRGAH